MLPVLQASHWHYLIGAVLSVLLLLYLRSELTPKRVISLFESENSLSIRLVLATVVVAYTLNMQRSATVNVMLVETNYAFAALLLGLGVAKIVGKAFADRPSETKVEAKNANISGGPINVEGSLTPEPDPPLGPLAGTDYPSTPPPGGPRIP